MANVIEYTPDQKNAMKANGTVLVSAAAGSGKTAILTERVARKICDRNSNISADRLLIVTFTNDAAFELRSRITKKIDERCKEEPNNQYILEQKMLLQSAKICTIDSFCIALVRSYFSVLGISPDFTIADNATAENITEKALETVLKKHYLDPEPSFNKLCNLFSAERSEFPLKSAIKDIYFSSECMSQPLQWFEKIEQTYNATDLKDSIFAVEVLKHIKNDLLALNDIYLMLSREVADNISPKALTTLNDNIEKIKSMISLAEDGCWDALINAAAEKPTFSKASVKDQALKDIVDFVNNKVKSVFDSINKRMVGESSSVLNQLNESKELCMMLIALVKEFKEAYFEELTSKNCLTFGMVEQLALKLLCEEENGELVPSELSKEIAGEFDEVLVDEYQDNNDLQDALFFALSDSGKKLFFVGDVKQSIYGFRNASPENFIRYKESFELYSEGKEKSKVLLKSNFRSKGSVCDFVNAFCKVVMQKDTCSMDYTDEDILDAKAEYPELSAPAVELLLNDFSNTDNKALEVDAKAVADYIAKTLKEGKIIRKDKNTLREPEFKDFTILLRSPGNKAEAYINALKEKGIPAVFNSDKFTETPEILTITEILRVISNPLSDVSLLSVMTSVIFGFIPDEIVSIRCKNKKVSLYSNVVLAAGEGNARCIEFLKTISYFRKASATLTISKLINEIYKKTSLIELFSALPDGSSRKQNLRRFAVLAEGYESRSGASIKGFIKEIEKLSDKDFGGADSADLNAVKILSFHKSKGLQFPICIVANLAGLFNTMDFKNNYIFNQELGLGLKHIDMERSLKGETVAFNGILCREKQKLIAEEIRLLYVAMTRAEDRLVLSLSSKSLKDDISAAAVELGSVGLETGVSPVSSVISANSYAKWVLMTALLKDSSATLASYAELEPLALSSIPNFKVSISDSSVFNQVDDLSNEDATSKRLNLDFSADYSKLKEKFEFLYPNIAETLVPSKVSVTELIKGDDNAFYFSEKPEFLSKAGLTPAERGTAAHKFMQFANYKAAKADIEAELLRLKEWEFISEAEADAIETESLKKFFESSVYDRINAADEVFREYKFMIEYPYLESQTIAQGIADCVFIENGELVILDFKTDNVKSADELVTRYADQLKIYSYALSRIFDMPVKESILFSLKLGKEVTVSE